MITRFIDWWRRSRFSRSPRLSAVRHVSTRSEVPDPLPRRVVVIVGFPAKWAIMSCPCGTDHSIDLNLANVGGPLWSVEGAPKPNIVPSIDVQDPVGRCHFWLRDGRVRWVQRRRSAPVSFGSR